MKAKNAVLLSTFISLFSCKPKYPEYQVGVFPDTPVNLNEFNTQYDDYNSASPVLGKTFPLCFSSNRKSQGENFDIIYKLMSVYFNKLDGILNVYNETNGNLDVVIANLNLNNALSKINTSSDEFGPFLISKGRNYNSSDINDSYQQYILLYSNNESGNQDIKFAHNLENEFYSEPELVSYLNSEFDEKYPVINSDSSILYFCSDKSGVFNIYKVNINDEKSILEKLSDNEEKEIHKVEIISSPGNDQCPFLIDFLYNGWHPDRRIMVFASDSAGGYGGYDLYYSVLLNEQWSVPVNMGQKINTEYDEFRPIGKEMSDFENNFLIFSSNRPGGKGGFDLYYVGFNFETWF